MHIMTPMTQDDTITYITVARALTAWTEDFTEVHVNTKYKL